MISSKYFEAAGIAFVALYLFITYFSNIQYIFVLPVSKSLLID